MQIKLGDKTSQVDRRYTEFKILNKEIKRLEPDIKLKRFPGRNYFTDNFSHNFIQKRMSGLNEYLYEILSYPAIIRLYGFFSFFCCAQYLI
jgi:hypothetical protein